MRKRALLLSLFLVICLVLVNVALLAAPKTITLSVWINRPQATAAVVQGILDKYVKENPGIKIDFNAPAATYENLMRVKMAANDMPDVFSTHGWAKIRYGSFLLDLKRERWASKISPSIKPQVTDEKGKVYVLPIDEDKSGMTYNVDILKQYGVEVPLTFDAFLAACETVKTKSGGAVTPVHVGGSDGWPEGQYYDYFATPELISPKANYAKQFLDGTFDWTKFDILPEKFLAMWKQGYINKDFLTSKYMDSAEALAEGKIAFAFYGGYVIEEARKINPKVNLGMMPIPSMVAGDEATFVGGEMTTLGVWNKAKNMTEAKKLVAYFAKPENIKLVAEAEKVPAGLTGIEVDAGALTPYYQKYAKLRVFPYWDRVYLPNGMWDVICRNAQDLVAGNITPRQFSENMEKEFKRLYAMAHPK